METVIEIRSGKVLVYDFQVKCLHSTSFIAAIRFVWEHFQRLSPPLPLLFQRPLMSVEIIFLIYFPRKERMQQS